MIFTNLSQILFGLFSCYLARTISVSMYIEILPLEEECPILPVVEYVNNWVSSVIIRSD